MTSRIKAGIIGTGFIGPAHVEAARRREGKGYSGMNWHDAPQKGMDGVEMRGIWQVSGE